MNVPTLVVLALLLVLVFFAVRRLRKNGMCDCHKGEDSDGHSCGCGCSACAAAEHMMDHIESEQK